MPDTTQNANERSRLWLKLAVIVLAGGGAAFLIMRPDPERKQPDAPETGVPFVCLKDGHHFQVTPAKFEAMFKSGDAQQGGGEAGESTSPLVLRCPKCSQMATVRGDPCPKDGSIVPRRLQNGKPGPCPKCGWSYYR